MSTRRASSPLPAAALAVGLGILLLLGPMGSPASAATPVPALDSTFSSLLNGLRTTLGLGELTVDGELSAVARTWSAHMAAAGVLAHNPSLSSQIQEWSELGENVGYGGGSTDIFNALVASPGHLRNMSDPKFTRVGIGTVTDGGGRVWTTHVFSRPMAVGAAAAPGPVAAPASTPAVTMPVRRARRAAATTVAGATAPAAPPATPAPVAAAAPATAPALATVEGAGAAVPTGAPRPASPVLVWARPTSANAVALLASAALFGILLILGAPDISRIRRKDRKARRSGAGSGEDLALVLDLGRR